MKFYKWSAIKRLRKDFNLHPTFEKIMIQNEENYERQVEVEAEVSENKDTFDMEKILDILE